MCDGASGNEMRCVGTEPFRDFPAGDSVVRLGKNINGYLGETIDIRTVMMDIEDSARGHGWAIEHFLESETLRLTALRRAPRVDRQNPARVYVSAGIHGDEPAGPLAVSRLLRENDWPPDLEFWICPCLNPSGFLLNRRENAEGVDLNRQYLQPEADETLAHISWLRRQPRFDLCFCLHEDWESHGFYVYELNPDGQPSLAEAMVESVA